MQIRRITNLDELAGTSGDWNRLAAGIPFRSWEWLGTWWRHYEPALKAAGRRVELYVLAVTEGDELVAIAPWYMDRSLRSGNVIRFLGSGEVCSDYLSVLCQPSRQTEVAEALADWLNRSSHRTLRDGDRWDLIELACVDVCEAMPRLLGEKLTERGAHVQSREADHTWRIELPSTFDEYLNLLSKSHRKQLRQFQRRFFDTNRAVLRTVRELDQLETGWQILTDLHQRRLESLGKPGSFKSEAFRQFHREASECLFSAGLLQLHWLEFEGRAIAAEYHLSGQEILFAYQGGIDPDALEHEPGRLITLATLHRALEAGYRGFDFCRGDEPYKQHWRASARSNCSWRIVANRSSSRLRNHLWTAGQSARQWAKYALRRGLHNTVEQDTKTSTGGQGHNPDSPAAANDKAAMGPYPCNSPSSESLQEAT